MQQLATTAELFAHCEALSVISTRLLVKIRRYLSERTDGGRLIDDFQVPVRKFAQMATRVEAAKHLAEFAGRTTGNDADAIKTAAAIFMAETVEFFAMQANTALPEFGLDDADFRDGFRNSAVDDMLRACLREANYRTLGLYALENDAHDNRHIWTEIDGEVIGDVVQSTRRFARDVVSPVAQEIHLQDLSVPEDIIKQMGELGFFGLSVPTEYGGLGMGNLPMVVVTEELSAASLGAAGSLITRPEVLGKSLIAGGTEAQKKRWLEPMATGKLMVAVSVTEPDTGSDVANIRCRARPATHDGIAGYRIDGNKSWCTFAGRADLLVLLARTGSELSLGHRGLSMFVIEKEAFGGHDFEVMSNGGGKLIGKADRTLGYRGMHSYSLQFDNFFVPAKNLVGGAEGEGRGFYLQMEGFAAGRLQTGGRATGVAQASMAAAVRYALDRKQFGRPIGEFQSTQYELGRMFVQVDAARQLTHAGARAMDAGAADATVLAAMAKLLACRTAVTVSQSSQLLHGGWGFAEEFPVARYVVDSLVLPIFEGVEPILEMKMIGRALLRPQAD
ncbi:MAG: acyl-CoA dehydrogenase family protein [Alphaproteobacteria bacterium]